MSNDRNDYSVPLRLAPGQFLEFDTVADLSAFKKPMTSLYVGGSLRNPLISEFAAKITALGIEAFCDWFGTGPNADDHWRDYAKIRGWSYRQALESAGARNVFEFDRSHLDRTDGMVLLMPAGKSAHLELGYTIGRGKPGYIVFPEEPPTDRWEVMVQFATQIFFSQDEFFKFLQENKQ